MLDFQWENSDSKLEKLEGIIQIVMLAPLFCFKFYGLFNKWGKYIRHYLLDYPSLWVVISADYYSPMKDK